MGIFLSVEDNARKNIANNIKKTNINKLDIDKLFEDAYFAQPIPEYKSFRFAKLKGEQHLVGDEIVTIIKPPSLLNIDEQKLINYIRDNTDKPINIWKALNLIGYYGNLGLFISRLPVDTQEQCKLILKIFFETREITLLNAKEFFFIYQ